MMRGRTLTMIGFAVGAGVLLAAATAPTLLNRFAGGLWEVSRSATGADPVRMCIASPARLAQFEHRGRACTRVVIADKPEEALIHYTCPDGGFGRSRIEMITPRSLRIDTQGISGGAPFAYVLHARLAGSCAAH